MPTIYKVLGQANPASATLTSLYTVPSATSAVCSSMTVANLANASATFRIAVRPAGAAAENKHYIVYDITIAALDTLTLTLGVTLATTDVVSVYASSATLAFSAYGSEIS